jgi:hypothetical protein
LQLVNPKEDDRLESIGIAKLRGKGPPKKKKEKDSEFSSRKDVDTMLIYATSDQGEEKEIVTLSVTGKFIRAAVNHVAFLALVGTVQNGIISSALRVLHFGFCFRQHFALASLLPFSFRLLNCPSTIHFHVHACDEFCLVAGKEERRVRHVFGIRQSSLWFSLSICYSRHFGKQAAE